MELKRIDFEKGELITDNYKYTIAKSISVEKYQEFELLQCEVAYGYTFDDINKNIIASIDSLNKVDFVKAAVILDNLRNSIANGIERREHPVVRMCMLFLIREDENEREYSETFHKEKYNDVIKSGVDYRDFFTLAMNILPGLLQAYKEISQATMSEAEKRVNDLLRATESEKLEQNNTGQNS